MHLRATVATSKRRLRTSTCQHWGQHNVATVHDCASLTCGGMRPAVHAGADRWRHTPRPRHCASAEPPGGRGGDMRSCAPLSCGDRIAVLHRAAKAAGPCAETTSEGSPRCQDKILSRRRQRMGSSSRARSRAGPCARAPAERPPRSHPPAPSVCSRPRKLSLTSPNNA